MNLREGTRRLALLLGVVGALGGSFVAYLEWQDIQSQRTRHDKFEQLANSDVVKEQRKTLQSPDPYASIAKPLAQSGNNDPFASIAKPIPQHGRAKLSDITPPAKVYLDDNGNPIATTSSSTAPSTADSYAEFQTPLSSEVNKGGIRTITWAAQSEVYSIETTDGQTLYPTAAPSAWLYLLIALLPLLGFLIPWGAIRSIGWVMTGFVQPPK